MAGVAAASWDGSAVASARCVGPRRPAGHLWHHGAACLAGPIPRSRCAGGAQRPGTACRAAREKDRSVGHASRLAAALVAVAVSFSSLWPAPLPALALGRLTAEETRTVEMFKRSRPSVVFITTLRKAKDSFTQDVMDVPLGEGTGFVWDKSGHIVTNLHVVRGSGSVQVTVTLPNGKDTRDYVGRIIGSDGDKDVAVLAIDVPPEDRQLLQPLPVGRSAEIMVGQRVFVIGNPFGLDHTLTSGLVSAVDREISSGVNGRPIQGVIQTDAAINPGNSGGPLLDSSGYVIGMTTAIYSASGASNGVGFAVPVDAIRTSVEQILANGRVVRPVMGIGFAPDATASQLGIQGILVLECERGGPADRAGIRGTSRDPYGRLRLGDIIVGVNGKPVRSAGDLYKALEGLEVGQRILVEVVKEGKDAPDVVAIVLDGRDTTL